MILVRDRMTAPAITIHLETPVGEIGRLLAARAISAVPVVENNRLVGIVSTTDILKTMTRAEVMRSAASTSTSSSRSRSAADLMSTPVMSVGPNDRLDEAAWRLVAGRVHRLVVVDEDEPIGILSARDMLAELVQRRVVAPIGSIMTTPVESIAIGDTVNDAIDRLTSASVHGVVVVDGMSPVGVFTQLEALAAQRLPPALREGPVENLMSYETICLDVATPIYRAAGYLVSMNVRRILVVEARHLVGILSCVDLVGVLARAPAVAA